MKLWDTLNLMNTVKKLSSKESLTGFLMKPQSSVTFENLTQPLTAVQLTLLQEDSLASPSQSQEEKKERTTQETCGQKPFELLSRPSQRKHFWKMYQGYSVQDILVQSLTIYPKQGMTQNGLLCRPQIAEPRTKEKGYGFLPTPDANDGKRGPTKTYNSRAKSQSGRTLSSYVSQFPTPSARDWKDTGTSPAELARNTPPLATHAGGQLNPNWVEWLMGWPIGSTDLLPLEMDKFQSWLEMHI